MEQFEDNAFLEPLVTISPENGAIISLGSNPDTQEAVLRAIKEQGSEIQDNRGEPMLESVALESLKEGGLAKVKSRKPVVERSHSVTEDKVLWTRQAELESQVQGLSSKLDTLLEVLTPKDDSEVEKSKKSATLEPKGKTPPDVKL